MGLVARQLAGGFVAALLIVAALLLLLVVRHALLEAFEPLGDVTHHGREAVPAKNKQENDRKDQNVPNAQTAHWETPLRRVSSPPLPRFPAEAGKPPRRGGRAGPRP